MKSLIVSILTIVVLISLLLGIGYGEASVGDAVMSFNSDSVTESYGSR